jgi:topoisomerase-4 subunit B
MGKNTPERQDFIIDNLRVEKDIAEEILADTHPDDLEQAS